MRLVEELEDDVAEEEEVDHGPEVQGPVGGREEGLLASSRAFNRAIHRRAKEKQESTPESVGRSAHDDERVRSDVGELQEEMIAPKHRKLESASRDDCGTGARRARAATDQVEYPGIVLEFQSEWSKRKSGKAKRHSPTQNFLAFHLSTPGSGSHIWTTR